jgi:hypothetical protein
MVERIAGAPIPYHLLADLVVLAHFGFVLFVILGGLLAARWPGIVWFHLAAAAWGTAVECAGWICPLTPVENWLRQRAGEDAYAGDFLARYLLPLLYPEGLTRQTQIALGVSVIAVNVLVYGWILRRKI